MGLFDKVNIMMEDEEGSRFDPSDSSAKKYSDEDVTEIRALQTDWTNTIGAFENAADVINGFLDELDSIGSNVVFTEDILPIPFDPDKFSDALDVVIDYMAKVKKTIEDDI